MSVTVEKLENLERKIILSLPWSDINTQVDARLKNTQRRVKIDGFRPGKAPLNMVNSMYGAGIRDEVLNEMAKKAFYETAVSEKLNVAGLQKLDALSVEEQDDQALFKVAAIFEIYPEITIGDLSAQSITKITTEVNEPEIDKAINILRQQRTKFNRVERAAKDGDRVIIDFVGKINNEVFDGGSSKNQAILLGSGRMIPGFEDGILGMKESETKDITATFPEDYQEASLAGKEAIFTITLNNVSEPTLPEIDADFAKSLGIESGDVKQMREEIGKNVLREVNRRVESMTKENVLEALLKSTPIEVPNVLIAQESEHLANQMRENLQNQGMDSKNFDLPVEMFADNAKRRVSISLIMSKIIETEKLSASEEQVKAIVNEFAESYEDPKEVVDWYYSDPKNLQAPTSLAVEKNVVDYILSKAKVEDKKLPFDEIMSQQPMM